MYNGCLEGVLGQIQELGQPLSQRVCIVSITSARELKAGSLYVPQTIHASSDYRNIIHNFFVYVGGGGKKVTDLLYNSGLPPQGSSTPPYVERVFGALVACWVLGDCLSHL
jgi:hypothetical protein